MDNKTHPAPSPLLLAVVALVAYSAVLTSLLISHP